MRRSDAPSISLWFVLAGSFAAAPVFAVAGIVLILPALSGHGSPPGEILRVALGVASLFLGLFFTVVGVLCWSSLTEASRNSTR